MSAESNVSEGVARLLLALETNTVDTLTPSDFRVFIDCSRKRTKIPNEILQEASKNLFLILSSGNLCNDSQIVVATAYVSTVTCLELDSEKIFHHFVELLSQNEEQEHQVYLCYAFLQLHNSYWAPSSKIKEQLLNVIFKVVRSLCCKLKSTTCLAFKVLYNLLCTIHQLNSDGKGVSHESFNEMLNIVMSNWENPLSGVRQHNSLVLGQLLLFDEELWDSVLPESAAYTVPTRSVRHQCLLEQVLSQLSWLMKSKYLILSAVIQKSNISQIMTNYGEDLREGLLLSLSVPHLVSAGTDLYRVILSGLSYMDWSHWFFDPLTQILSDLQISLELENVFSYWIHHTVKKTPLVLKDLLLQTSLNDYSYICIQKISRKDGLVCSIWDSVDGLKIKNALEGYCEKTRSQAFSLVCISSKTSEPPTGREFDVVKQYLTQNINSDNTPLRQSTLNSFTSFTIRIRDSLLHLIKIKSLNEVSVTKCLEFLEWLHLFLILNLKERCNYQRKITSLELYKVILNYFGESEGRKEKCYARKTNKDHLNLKIQEAYLSQSYKFESDLSRRTLFNCLCDEDSNVRASSAHILITYFKIFDSDYEELGSLFRTGMNLCLDQTFYKAESGAKLVHVLVTLSCKSSTEKIRNLIYNGKKSFLTELLNSAELQFRCLLVDLLKAASQGSFLYGTLQAIELLLTDPLSPEFNSLKGNDLERLISLMEKVTQFFIAVLFSKSDPNSDFAPSFGEMGMAIAAVVESSTVKDTDVTVSPADTSGGDLQLTPAQQLVLSCIWLNLKQCSKLCSGLVNYPLSVSAVERCVRIVVTILHRCRHKGAIEAAGLALYHVTRFLTTSPDALLTMLPAQVLEGFLETLVGSTAATVSRRSAGLAILVHRLITGDARPKKPLLHSCVSRLLPIASDTTVTDSDNLVDLPQSQALHFLRTLVQESSLREHMAQYTIDISLVALTNLASPIWTIRNAALQLFGALVPKLVGQKPHQEEGRGNHHFSFEELYTHAKPLVEMMLKEITTAAKSSEVNEHSKLMPFLTLATNLTVGMQCVLAPDMCEMIQSFQENFQLLFKSYIFNVRKLSAKAHSLFLPSSKIVPTIEDSVLRVEEFLLCKKGYIQSENELHGYLLNIICLLERFNEEKTGMRVLLKQEETLFKILNRLCEELLSSQHSHFVKSLAFDIKCQNYLVHDLIKVLDSTSKPTLGFSHFINKQLSTAILTFNDNDIEKVVKFCLFKCSDCGIQLSCMEALVLLLKLKREHQNKLSKSHLLSLFKVMKDFVSITNISLESLSLALELMAYFLEEIAKISGLNGADILFCSKFLSHSFSQLFSDHMSTTVISYLLPIVCGILCIRETIDVSNVEKVATMIKDRSDPDFDQDMRISVAKSINILGPLLRSEVTKQSKCGELLWEACVDLLQDEIVDVRYEASRFVTTFFSGTNTNSFVWNPFLSLEVLFKYSSIVQLVEPDKAIECFWGRLLCISVDKSCGNKISNPFDHGVKSIYAEEAVVSHLAQRGLLELLKLNESSLKLKVKELCCAFRKECAFSSNMNECLEEIEHYVNNHNVSVGKDR